MPIYKTKQSVFNDVAAHLLTQKKRAIDRNRCRYRGPDGTKCAIGCLIPDDLYDPDMEGQTLTTLALKDKFSSIIREIFSPNIDIIFLGDLQATHDAIPPKYWIDELKNLAIKYELDSSILSKFGE